MADINPNNMARTITQIKSELTAAFMADTTLAANYGFTPGADFDKTFSKVSIENILLYIVAAALWTHERLFDEHRAEVENLIAQLKPHTLRWYVSKVKQYRNGQPLIDGTDQYDDTGLTDDDIAQRQVVHFAAATEAATTIYIKVATDNNGTKQPLTTDQLNGLKAYIAEVKDAGVRVEIINEAAYHLRLSLVIYYDPMVLSPQGMHLQQGGYPVNEAIKSYIENLPFNGEYSNTALTDVLQQTDGVKIPEITASAESATGTEEDFAANPIDVKSIPHSGYYVFEEANVTIDYRPYESV